MKKEIFRFDSRDKYVTEARHWSDAHTIAGRAFFKEHEEPPHLALENIMATDVGSYKCRVDFYKAPTQISEVVLRVIGKKDRMVLRLVKILFLLKFLRRNQRYLT